MGCTEAAAKTGVYHPRKPHTSQHHQCAQKHYEELAGSGVVHRRIEEQLHLLYRLYLLFSAIYVDLPTISSTEVSTLYIALPVT